MRITHFLLGLGLLGLFGMAFATSKDNLSSLPPSKETPSDPQVIKLVMKLEDILKKKNEIFFEKEALDELINRLDKTGYPNPESAKLEAAWQQSEKAFKKATQRYQQVGEKLKALDPAAYAQVNQQNHYAIDSLGAFIVMRNLARGITNKGEEQPKWLQTSNPVDHLPTTEQVKAMVEYYRASSRPVHKRKMKIISKRLAQKYGVVDAVLTAGKVIELSSHLQSALDEKNQIYLKKVTIEEIIAQLGADGDPEKKIPRLEQALEQVDRDYEIKNKYYQKIGQELHTLDANASKKIRQNNIIRLDLEDTLKVLSHHPEVWQSGDYEAISHKLPPTWAKNKDGISGLTRQIISVAQEYGVPSFAIDKGKSAKLGKALRNVLREKNTDYLQKEALRELIDVGEFVKIPSEKLATMKQDLLKIEAKFKRLDARYKKIGQQLKVFDEKIYQKIDKENIFEFDDHDFAVLTGFIQKLFSFPKDKSLARLYKMAQHHEEVQSEIASRFDKLAEEYGVMEIIDRYISDRESATQANNRPNCAANVLPPKKP